MQPPRRLHPHAGRDFTSHSVPKSAGHMPSVRWQNACLLSSIAMLFSGSILLFEQTEYLTRASDNRAVSLHKRSKQIDRPYHSRHLQLACSKPSTRPHSKRFCLPSHLSHPRFQSFAPTPCAHMPYHSTHPPLLLCLPPLYTFILTGYAVIMAAHERMAFLDLRQSWLRMQHHMS